MTLTQKLKYFFATLAVLFLGLASRRLSSPGSFMYNYIGDVLWAAMIYFGFRFLLTHFSKRKTSYIALSFCVLIEISQLYQAPWINAIRQTTFGGLILGFGFQCSDLLGYCVGIFCASLMDSMNFVNRKKIL